MFPSRLLALGRGRIKKSGLLFSSAASLPTIHYCQKIIALANPERLLEHPGAAGTSAVPILVCTLLSLAVKTVCSVLSEVVLNKT